MKEHSEKKVFVKKYFSVLLICMVLLYTIYLFTTAIKGEIDSYVSIPTSTPEVIKDEPFEKLKNYLKENGTYSDNSYVILSNNSYEGMYFSLSYDVLHDNIVIYGKEPRSNCTGVMFFSDNEPTFSYTISYDDCIFGSGTMAKSNISENTKALNFSDLKYKNDIDSSMTANERMSTNEHISSLGASMLIMISACYTYEMLIHLIPVTLPQLGFTNLGPN